MRVLFRCDGGPGIGAGHVVRCVALAEEAVARGHEVAFAGTFTGDFLSSLLADLEASATVLGQVPESGDKSLAVVAQGYDVVHVDHYELSDLWGGNRARAATPGGAEDRRGDGPLVSNMCDGAFGARSADLLVDPTPGAEQSPAPVSVAWSLRGGRFSPIRTEVLRRRRTDALRPDAAANQPLRVLVVMGGTDPRACAPLVVDALADTGLDLDVLVVSTPATDDALRTRQASWRSGRLTVTPPVTDLPEQMARADLVVTAAGTSVWELCALGTPMAAVMVVENQRPGYELAVGAGAAVGLGGPEDLEDLSVTAAALREVLGDERRRTALAERAHQLVDGLGAWRIVSSWEAIRAGASTSRGAADLVARSLAARPVEMSDAELLWRWRNDPATRANSRTSDEVPWDSHVSWLAASLAREDRLLLVAEDDTGPVGTVRWDLVQGGEWEVSITVAPDRRGQGLAGALLSAGEETLRARGVACTGFLATVHRSNAASERLFLSSGYLPERPADEQGFARFHKGALPSGRPAAVS